MTEVVINKIKFKFYHSFSDIYEEALSSLDNSLNMKIFACDARVHYLLQLNELLVEAYSEAIIIADGRPLFLLGKKLSSRSNLIHITGPTLFEKVINSKTFRQRRHYFFGSTESVLTAMEARAKAEGVQVVGSKSPPLIVDIENYDIDELVNELESLGTEFFWCGLGAPKQEILISRLDKRLSGVVFVGVGLGFDYYAQSLARPPKWFSNLGIEWMYRYYKQPYKIKRFVVPFFYMLYIYMKTLLEFYMRKFSTTMK